jgi:TolB protein
MAPWQNHGLTECSDSVNPEMSIAMNAIHNHRKVLTHAGRILTALTVLWLKSAAAAIGDFESHTDIGNPAKAGGADYDVARQEYRISGAGKNMWFSSDEFHFVWKQLEGDFILNARAEFIGPGANTHRKLGWMVRPIMDPGSPHLNAVVHGDGLTSLQFRRTPGGTTEELKSSLTAASVIQLERRGNRYLMSVARFGQPFVTTELNDHALGDKVYVGLFVCSHDAQVVEQAVFKNVRITIPARAGFVPYRDYLGSRLETLDADTGDQRVLYRTPEAIEAPNWMPDGKALIYNSKGRLFRFAVEGGEPSPINTGFATKCNNDHVISFDGKMLGISHQPREAGSKSFVYILPVTGGEPRRVTDKAPSYLHGWSPDGKSLVYTAEREGDFDIYKVSINGGEEPG